MCGIVGLYAKSPEVEAKLGTYLSSMLVEMTERGPDSAGVAFYRDPVAEGEVKIALASDEEDFNWHVLIKKYNEDHAHDMSLEIRGTHALVKVADEFVSVKKWLKHFPSVRVVGYGDAIEIFKETGLPVDVIEQFDLRSLNGTHALGHTRMATESAVTTAGSHPFSTGPDLCLVHNGSLSNHNRLRSELQAQGIDIQTQNDSEVAAGYISLKMRDGATLEEALESALDDLDGFFTFAVGTRDGFAVMRDHIACKHAVMAETDDWVAMATEFRAIATLPGAENAKIWEPEPGKIYSWSRK